MVAYKSRVEILEDILKSVDKVQRLSWKDDLFKLTPWKINKADLKRKRLDPQAEEDDK